MIYALILTTYLYGPFDSSPVAVTQTSTPGFTTEQACKNAGRVAQAGAVSSPIHGRQTVITYQCAPLSI